jgi:hypothetical protein
LEVPDIKRHSESQLKKKPQRNGDVSAKCELSSHSNFLRAKSEQMTKIRLSPGTGAAMYTHLRAANGSLARIDSDCLFSTSVFNFFCS